MVDLIRVHDGIECRTGYDVFDIQSNGSGHNSEDKYTEWQLLLSVATAAFWLTFNHEGKISSGW
jgi:hypothetical protein